MTVEPRTLPHDHEAERVLLGAWLVNPAAVEQIRGAVRATDFHSLANRRVFEALGRLADRGVPADVVALRQELQREDLLEGCGGPAYLATLLDGIPRSATAVHHAETIRRLAWRRSIAQRSDALTRAALNGVPDEHVAEMLEGLSTNSGKASGRQAFDPQQLDVQYAMIADPEPIPWLYRPWIADRDRVLLAADGGVGKSVVALDLALAMTVGGSWLGIEGDGKPRRVLYIDEEMPEGIARRRLRALGSQREFDPDRIRYFCQAGFNFDESATLPRLRKELEWVGEEGGFLIVDTLVRVHHRDENVNAEMAEVLAVVLAILREAGVGLVTLHHESKGGPNGRQGQQAARGASEIANWHDTTTSYARDGERRTLRLNKSRWWAGGAEVFVEADTNDRNEVVGLKAADVGGKVAALIRGRLAVAADAGVARSDLIEAVEADLNMKAETAKKSVNRAVARLPVSRRKDGRAMRYWLRECAPEDAE